MKKPISLAFIVLMLLLSSCFKEEELESQPWNPDFTLPFIKSDLELEDLTNVQDLTFNEKIAANELDPSWEGEVPFVPPVQGLSTENTPNVFEISEYFNRIMAIQVTLTVTFKNNFPIVFGKGTQLVFRNQQSQEIVSIHELQNDVAPGDSYVFPINIQKTGAKTPTLESFMEFYLQDFRSPGSATPVNFDGATTVFVFELEFIEIEKVEANINQLHQDTVSFVFDVLSNISNNVDDVAEGDLRFYVSNSLPINVNLNGELLDENGNLLTVIFEKPLELKAADVDQTNGNIITKQEDVTYLKLDYEKQKKLFNGGRMRIYFDVNTTGVVGNGTFVSFTGQSKLKLQLVGNLKVQMDKVDLEL